MGTVLDVHSLLLGTAQKQRAQPWCVLVLMMKTAGTSLMHRHWRQEAMTGEEPTPRVSRESTDCFTEELRVNLNLSKREVKKLAIEPVIIKFFFLPSCSYTPVVRLIIRITPSASPLTNVWHSHNLRRHCFLQEHGVLPLATKWILLSAVKMCGALGSRAGSVHEIFSSHFISD